MSDNEIYIASPLGFSESGRMFMYEKLFPVIKQAGFGIIDPWELTPQDMLNEVLQMSLGIEKVMAWQKLNNIIGENNAKGIERSIGILAMLDGPDVDSGTAAEVGYCAALQKPVLGYRSDHRMAGDNEGAVVNLQVEYFISLHSGSIARSLEEIERQLPLVFSKK